MNSVLSPAAHHPMVGHLADELGRIHSPAGFMSPMAFGGFTPAPRSTPIAIERAMMGHAGLFDTETKAMLARLQSGEIQRGEVTGDINQILMHLGASLTSLERGITSATTGFPVRENLEAESKILVPLETPVRNRLPRVPGAGKAVLWRQTTALGGGWDNTLDQPGSAGAVQSFFGESGAPAAHTTTYASKTASYKLMGTFGSVTGFAMAAGANFQNQYATEKTNSIRNLMLNEENALINGDSTSTAAPWGDGGTAFAFDGLINLVTTANGTPSAQVVTSVGALTTTHIDAQLAALWKQGARGVYMIMNQQEIQSLVHLATAAGTIVRINATMEGKTVLGAYVTGYVHPITGEIVDVIASRFIPAGTILFISQYLPDGTPTVQVNVLPQVQLPALAPNEQIQGYVAQDLAPTQTAVQVYAWCVSVFQVLELHSAVHCAKSTGVTGV